MKQIEFPNGLILTLVIQFYFLSHFIDNSRESSFVLDLLLVLHY